ncbi:hypothetical protein ENBRE01_2657, partial [Enteropsectra breve]
TVEQAAEISNKQTECALCHSLFSKKFGTKLSYDIYPFEYSTAIVRCANPECATYFCATCLILKSLENIRVENGYFKFLKSISNYIGERAVNKSSKTLDNHEYVREMWFKVLPMKEILDPNTSENELKRLLSNEHLTGDYEYYLEKFVKNNQNENNYQHELLTLFKEEYENTINRSERLRDYYAECPACYFGRRFNPNEYLEFAVNLLVNGKVEISKLSAFVSNNVYIFSSLLVADNFDTLHKLLFVKVLFKPYPETYIKPIDKNEFSILKDLIMLVYKIKEPSRSLRQKIEKIDVFVKEHSHFPSKNPYFYSVAFEYLIDNKMSSLEKILTELFSTIHSRQNKVINTFLYKMFLGPRGEERLVDVLEKLTIRDKIHLLNFVITDDKIQEKYPDFTIYMEKWLNTIRKILWPNAVQNLSSEPDENYSSYTLNEGISTQIKTHSLQYYRENRKAAREFVSFANNGITNFPFEGYFKWIASVQNCRDRQHKIESLFSYLTAKLVKESKMIDPKKKHVPRTVLGFQRYMKNLAINENNPELSTEKQYIFKSELQELDNFYNLDFILARSVKYFKQDLQESFDGLLMKIITNKIKNGTADLTYLVFKELIQSLDLKFDHFIKLVNGNKDNHQLCEELLVFALIHCTTDINSMEMIFKLSEQIEKTRLISVMRRALENAEFLNLENVHAMQTYVEKECQELQNTLLEAMGRSIELYDTLSIQAQEEIFEHMLATRELEKYGMIIFSIKSKEMLSKLNPIDIKRIINCDWFQHNYDKITYHWLINGAPLILHMHFWLIISQFKFEPFENYVFVHIITMIYTSDWKSEIPHKQADLKKQAKEHNVCQDVIDYLLLYYF